MDDLLILIKSCHHLNIVAGLVGQPIYMFYVYVYKFQHATTKCGLENIINILLKHLAEKGISPGGIRTRRLSFAGRAP